MYTKLTDGLNPKGENNMKDLKDKVAVVTGGASGIGLGIARALAKKGTHIVIADMQQEKAKLAADELAKTGVKILSFACDVSERSSVARLADEAWSAFGHVDIIVNNAGVFPGVGPLVDAQEDAFRWVLDVNVIGVWHGCSIFGKRFQEQGTPAHIVNTGSENSISPAHPYAGFYTASKHAVLALSDILRMELPDFIGVSIVCPGAVKTQLMNSSRYRLDRFGGPTEPDPAISDGGQMQSGMEADEIGERTVKGVENGDFYIVTHPHVREFVEERYNELLAAFDAQAPHYPGDDIHNPRKLLEQTKIER
jgi:NAD(P)-dependent dehydrogenase (short-subunit alcohol dehydrogenase family)